MNEYVNGPWVLGRVDGDFVRINVEGHIGVLTAVWRVKGMHSSPKLEEHARRVVASMNACAGVPIDELIPGGYGKMQDEIDLLKKDKELFDVFVENFGDGVVPEPRPVILNPDAVNDIEPVTESGTLRDSFASSALQGLLASLTEEYWIGVDKLPISDLRRTIGAAAGIAYEIADAMLTARGIKHD